MSETVWAGLLDGSGEEVPHGIGLFGLRELVAHRAACGKLRFKGPRLDQFCLRDWIPTSKASSARYRLPETWPLKQNCLLTDGARSRRGISLGL